MTENLVLNVAITGPCSWVVSVRSVLHGTSTPDPGAPFALSGPAGGGQWSATVLSTGQANWSLGTHDMTIVVGATVTSVSHGLLVCAWTPPGQRSSSATVC
jgi:hypothetical protein